jgi:signal transduction histidine kinase/ActR/RegA family two-component response regulator
MSKFRSILTNVIGDVEKIGSERYFITVTTFTASIFLYVLCIIHYAMNLKIAPIFFAGSSATIILGLYFLVRFGNCLFIPKLILSVLGLLMLDITWYSKFLSNGPVLYFILIFGALILWVWEGRSLVFLLVFYFLNLLILFFLDYYAPESLLRYTVPDRRTLDIYLSLTLYSALLIFILFVIKKDFHRQTNKAIQSDKLKSAFLANMSHEIRTPLNSIVGFSQLLKEAPEDKLRSKYYNFIQKSSEQLLNIINDIIDLSKIEAGDLEIRYSSFRIKELFVELYDIFQIELSRSDKRHIHLNYTISHDDLTICSDYFRLKQVLVNLLKNATKFTTEGSVTYSCIEQKKEITFTVSDTGTGIPVEHKEKIFERFVKFNYLGMNHEGSGIGLSIVESILKALNGKIWLESEVGKGSKFYFAIPNKLSYAGYKKMIIQENQRQLTKFSRTKSILVVEDDRPDYQLIKEGLKSLNVEIHNVTDGKDAIDYIKLYPDTDLILMDFKLPYLSGYEATKEIKRICPYIPVIGQTAYAMSGDKERALSAGCDNYITKPLDLVKLQALVESYLTEN